jgi:hypothetical protein
MRVGTRGYQISRQHGLIVFDREKARAPQSINIRHERFLGRKSISGADSPGERHTGQQRLGSGDLSGLCGHGHVKERVLVVMRAEGEHVGSWVLVRSGSAHGVAIQGNRIFWFSTQRAAYPACQSTCTALGMHARQECAEKGITRTEKPAWAEQTGEGIVLSTTPVPDGQGCVTMTEPCKAQSMRRVWRGKAFIQAQQRFLLESVLTMITGQ